MLFFAYSNACEASKKRLFELDRERCIACLPCVIDPEAGGCFAEQAPGRQIVIAVLRADACRCRGKRRADPMIPICDDQE
jgi:hypothetical protein